MSHQLAGSVWPARTSLEMWRAGSPHACGRKARPSASWSGSVLTTWPCWGIWCACKPPAAPGIQTGSGWEFHSPPTPGSGQLCPAPRTRSSCQPLAAAQWDSAPSCCASPHGCVTSSPLEECWGFFSFLVSDVNFK